MESDLKCNGKSRSSRCQTVVDFGPTTGNRRIDQGADCTFVPRLVQMLQYAPRQITMCLHARKQLQVNSTKVIYLIALEYRLQRLDPRCQATLGKARNREGVLHARARAPACARASRACQCVPCTARWHMTATARF